MGTFLETVVERTQADLAERKRRTPAAELRERLGPVRRGRPFSEALIAEGISLIAEMKRASPSRGPIRPDARVADIVSAYQEAGARAVSVLTEPEYFGGSLDDLVAARAACDLPLLRKDFVVDEYQLLEARLAGADAVLLLVAALEPARLSALIGAAAELGMDSLVEVHDEEEVEAAVDAGAEVIGVNNRNLHSLEVDIAPRSAAVDVPAGTVVVAESGIADRAAVRSWRSRRRRDPGGRGPHESGRPPNGGRNSSPAEHPPVRRAGSQVPPAPADAVTVSIQDIVGISGALARVNEIQAMLAAGSPSPAPAPVAPAGAPPGCFRRRPARRRRATPGGFAGVLSQTQGAAAAEPRSGGRGAGTGPDPRRPRDGPPDRRVDRQEEPRVASAGLRRRVRA